MTSREESAEAGAITSSDSDATINEIGRVLDVVAEFDGPIYDVTLRDELARVLGEGTLADGDGSPLTEKRKADLLILIERVSALLIRCEWTPIEFKAAIGCNHSAADLYQRIPLERCLAVLELLMNVTAETNGGSARDRSAVSVAVAAFRAALGDAEQAHDFWELPLEAGTRTAREFVAADDPANAFLVVVGHGTVNKVEISTRIDNGFHKSFAASLASG